MRKVAEDVREAVRVLPPWPVVAAITGGIAVVWPATFLYSRHVTLPGGDWISPAVAASAAWLCLVLAGIMVWEIATGRTPRLLAPEERSWRQEWRTAAVLVAGILLGWAFFK